MWVDICCVPLRIEAKHMWAEQQHRQTVEGISWENLHRKCLTAFLQAREIRTAFSSFFRRNNKHLSKKKIDSKNLSKTLLSAEQTCWRIASQFLKETILWGPSWVLTPHRNTLVQHVLKRFQATEHPNSVTEMQKVADIEQMLDIIATLAIDVKTR